MNRNNNSKWAGRFGYLIFIAVLVANCSQSSTDQDQDSPPPTNEEYPATETRQVTNSPTELPPGAQSTTSRGITPAMKTPLMPAHPDLEQLRGVHPAGRIGARRVFCIGLKGIMAGGI